MRFVWPPITQALSERQNKIADGLAAGERGQRELELAQQKSTVLLKEAKAEAADIIDKANKRGQAIIDESKENARTEGARLLDVAQGEIAQEVARAKQQLRDQVTQIAVLGAEKIIAKQIDEASNRALIDNLIDEL